MDTIYALSSGGLPSGVAIVRVSGPRARFAAETIAGVVTAPRLASLRDLATPEGLVIDRGIAIWFPGPGSFTGEDSVEFHVHGGRAVVERLLGTLADLPGFRLAEAGEFTRRAFENGKLDLTEIEGLADLIAAETELQRQQALRQADGHMRRELERWRGEMLALRARLEAVLDFADEEDVPEGLPDDWWDRLAALAEAIERALDDGQRGEIVRGGFDVVLMGRPNAGKSSLLNALAKRDVAIVAEQAGTTRDIIEVDLDIGGIAVRIVDTAGIRESADEIELEGVRRALARARTARLVVWLAEGDGDCPEDLGDVPVVGFRSKDDDGRYGGGGVSVVRAGGLDGFLAMLAERAGRRGGEAPLISRARHRVRLGEAAGSLRAALDGRSRQGEELTAEYLREAGVAIGRLTGEIGAEEILGAIFAEFCVGK